MMNHDGNCAGSQVLENGTAMADWQIKQLETDPEAMINASIDAMNDPRKGGLQTAFDIMSRANELYPDNLDVKVKYICLLFMKGYISRKIGADGEARRLLEQCVAELDRLRGMGLTPTGHTRDLESNACMALGEMEFSAGNNRRALELLERTDWQKHPYAVTLIACIHLDDPGQYARELSEEANFLVRAVNSDQWETPEERASAYYILSILFATGVSNGLKADVNTAWSYIQMCAGIDPEMAASELKKYSRSLFGKITYRP